ncbi:hypothetical protein BG011_001779 [Mortierella polycephala]|uniref:HTH APSES-type domain-containing protein n=1 Tax=Mortierella polycephala TaxID=41804 RepID=A0A9P6QH91_9FUNG|nr:hypothetical protein BG011_001779 [Mortierella polycephala]
MTSSNKTAASSSAAAVAMQYPARTSTVVSAVPSAVPPSTISTVAPSAASVASAVSSHAMPPSIPSLSASSPQWQTSHAQVPKSQAGSVLSTAEVSQQQQQQQHELQQQQQRYNAPQTNAGSSEPTLGAPSSVISKTVTKGQTAAQTISPQPSQPSMSAQSASELFLQQQLAHQRAATVLSTPKGQKSASARSPSQQQSSPPQAQSTQSPSPVSRPGASPSTSTPLASTDMPTSFILPPATNVNPQQIQHDLRQLQLHKQRQEAEIAAITAAATAMAGSTPNVNTGNADVLGIQMLPTSIQAASLDDNLIHAQQSERAVLTENNMGSGIGGAITTTGSVRDNVDLKRSAESSISPQDTGDVSKPSNDIDNSGSKEIRLSPSSTNSATILPGVIPTNGQQSNVPSLPGENASKNTSNSTLAIAESAGTEARATTPSQSIASSSANASRQRPGQPQIFKATYSGIPVFEMMCRGVAVMRRRSDSYLNATQILKVAAFDKPQRTRILEREVQRGEHEKVQGGYGKYQGTWVPYDRGLKLCEEYDVLELLKPLLEYQFSKTSSPPLAPKHLTAASSRPRKPREPRALGTPKSKSSKKGSNRNTSKSGMKGPVMGVIQGEGRDISMHHDLSNSEQEDHDDYTHSRAGSEASMDETMSIVSGQTRTPSPLELGHDISSSEASDGETYPAGRPRRRRRQRSREGSPQSRKKQQGRPGDELFIGYHGRQSARTGYHSPGGRRSRAYDPSDQDVDMRTADPTRSQYAETLLNYFVSDSPTLPSILIHPPSDLDFDLIIDEEGHTPLHWAVAMARTKIVRLLVQHGADIYRVNNQGQTALMRSVLFSNNFDMKTFASLLEILQKTIFTIDKNDQTVFHHIAVTAGMRGKVHASRYYMECLLDKLAQHPSELASIINVQDVVGDTALTIAARVANKKIVRLLLDAGADPKIRNKSGRNADDFLQDTDIQLIGSPSSSTPLFPLHPPPLHPQQPQYHQHQQHQSPYRQLQHEGSHRMSHTLSPHSHHPPSGLPPSAGPSSGSRMLGPGSSSSHPSPIMRPVTPPPMRHGLGGYPPSSHNPPLDRPPHSGAQGHTSPSRSPFHPPPNPSSTSGPYPGQLNPVSSGRGYPSHQQGGSHGGPLETNSSTNANGNRPSRRMIPAVTELFEHLTQSYEKDLSEKEQDLIEARNLLHGIQSEIQEGVQTIEELKFKTEHLNQAEEQTRKLEGMIRKEIDIRQRLRLEELVVQEETRLKREMELEKGKRAASNDPLNGAVDIDRIRALEKEAGELWKNLTRLQQSRKDQVEQIVHLKSQHGKRQQEYKRLIALCCNVSIDEVDGLLGPLLSTLGNEDA